MRDEAEQEALDGRLLLGIVESDHAMAQQALEAGADPNSPNRFPMHFAAQGGNVQMLRLLLAYGGDAVMEDPNGATPLMYAVANNMTATCDVLLQEFPDQPLETTRMNALAVSIRKHFQEEAMQRLLDAGAKPHAPIPHDSRHITPFDIAAQRQNGEAMHWMNQYGRAQLPDIASLTHDAVAAPGQPLLQHPDGWRQFGAICARLESLGTPLTKSDLTREFADGRSYLRRAAECYRLDEALDYLCARGEPLTPQDLLDREGKPNAFLTACMERQALGKLFTEENWLGQPHQALARVWRAVPEQERLQAPQFEQLRFAVIEAERAAQQGIGR